MKYSIILLVLAFVISVFASKEINVMTPTTGTVWTFGNIETVTWTTQATGPEKLYLFYYKDGDPTKVNKKAFYEIDIKYVEAGSVSVDLRITPELEKKLAELPPTSNKYFIRIGTDNKTGYSTSFTINGGKLTAEAMAQSASKNSYAYTAIAAIVIGIITTMLNLY